MVIRAGHLLAVWVVSGAALATLAVAAWRWAATIGAWVAALQRAYGTGSDAAWPLRADTHVHLVVSFCAALWFGLGCRLFAPRQLPWLPVALAILVAMSDELCQLGSQARTFQWHDQAGDAIGIALSIPLLLLLRRLEVARGPHRRVPPQR